ncbi:hypothetical protein RRG08_011018 [Elysia crispata]|uniref:Elongin-C n=1 Tax=Elysia crispata TaxID=231223 RepID=A0AAE0ZRR7_9GAST|nr:hypothetical protein RRG08_011018 [Elysia crispata]
MELLDLNYLLHKSHLFNSHAKRTKSKLPRPLYDLGLGWCSTEILITKEEFKKFGVNDSRISLRITCNFRSIPPSNLYKMADGKEEKADQEEKVYGGIEGQNSQYVKLISSDGHEFIVRREHALTSGTIKAMLSGPGQFSEHENNEINFREIPSHVLQKVCMYFTYKVRYTNSSTEIPEFPIAPEIALELLMASNFLDC